MQIHEVAERTGVTVRTLHHYDQIGLLKPDMVTPTGYRVYNRESLARLQQILFFRELGFPLNEIRRIMDHPGYDRQEALINQRALLLRQRQRMDRLLAHLDRIINQTTEEEETMDFQPFDTTELENAKTKYADEVKTRWGDTAAYAESQEKMKTYTDDKMAAIARAGDEILKEFANLRTESPESAQAFELVQRWQKHISECYYQCSNEILAGLGQMYCCDERFKANIDRHGEGTAAFLSAAIAAYCAQA